MIKSAHRKIAYGLVLTLMLAIVIPMNVFAVANTFTVSFASGNDTATDATSGITATGTITALTDEQSKIEVTLTAADKVLASGKLTIDISSTANGGEVEISPAQIDVIFKKGDTLPVATFDFIALATDNITDLVLTVTFVEGYYNDNAQTVEGDSSVENMLLQVTIPTALHFALDPFEFGADNLVLDGATSQIKKADYPIINKTGAPVRVDVEFTLTAKTGTTIVDSTAALEKDEVNIEDKKDIYFAAVGASAVASPYDYTNPATLAAVDAATKKASLSFALGKATTAGTTPDPALGVASFTFYGEMDTYAKWTAGDVTVSATYDITVLRAGTYAGYDDGTSGSVFIASALNMVKVAEGIPTADEYDVKMPRSAADGADVTYTGTGDSVTLYIVGAPAITSVIVTDAVDDPFDVDGNWSYDDEKGLLTIDLSPETLEGAELLATAVGTYEITTDAGVYTLEWDQR